MLVVLTILTGILYPLAITATAHILFPRQAEGSLIMRGNNTIGSTLIGRQFTSDRYFHSRPSAIGYTPLPSGASNLSSTSTVLADSVAARKTNFRGANFLGQKDSVPDDMIFTSGSGLDPDISLSSALLQVRRISAARGLGPAKTTRLLRIIDSFTRSGKSPVFANERVNVLLLNLALDSSYGSRQ